MSTFVIPEYYRNTFEQAGYSADKLPQLVLNDREIVHIRTTDMTKPVMKFQDWGGRCGIAIHLHGRLGTFGERIAKKQWEKWFSPRDPPKKNRYMDNILLLFQKSPDAKLWVFDWASLSMWTRWSMDEHHNQTDHVGGIIDQCPKCPFDYPRVNLNWLGQVLNGTHPFLMLAGSEEEKEGMNQYDLITHNLQEVLNVGHLCKTLKEKGRLNIYWGTAPTKSPHLGYFLPLLKIRDFLFADCNVTILLADVHSYLDEGFDSVSNVDARTTYYEFVLRNMLKAISVNSGYTIEYGHNIQLTPTYMRDLLKFSTLITLHDAKKAGTEVVKAGQNPRVSSLIYPLMQALDEVALDADAQLGGQDQRKIFTMSLDNIVKMGPSHRRCSYLINPLIPSLAGKGKMSASDDAGKITFLDTDKIIRKKINKAFCIEKVSDTTTNAPLALMKLIIFPVFGTVEIKRDEKWGGDLVYSDFKQLEDDWIDGKLASPDLKSNLADYVIKLVTPVRSELFKNMHLYEQAYSILKP